MPYSLRYKPFKLVFHEDTALSKNVEKSAHLFPEGMRVMPKLAMLCAAEKIKLSLVARNSDAFTQAHEPNS
jgi:hypothetical protein